MRFRLLAVYAIVACGIGTACGGISGNNGSVETEPQNISTATGPGERISFNAHAAMGSLQDYKIVLTDAGEVSYRDSSPWYQAASWIVLADSSLLSSPEDDSAVAQRLLMRLHYSPTDIARRHVPWNAALRLVALYRNDPARTRRFLDDLYANDYGIGGVNAMGRIPPGQARAILASIKSLGLETLQGDYAAVGMADGGGKVVEWQWDDRQGRIRAWNWNVEEVSRVEELLQPLLNEMAHRFNPNDFSPDARGGRTLEQCLSLLNDRSLPRDRKWQVLSLIMNEFPTEGSDVIFNALADSELAFGVSGSISRYNIRPAPANVGRTAELLSKLLLSPPSMDTAWLQSYRASLTDIMADRLGAPGISTLISLLKAPDPDIKRLVLRHFETRHYPDMVHALNAELCEIADDPDEPEDLRQASREILNTSADNSLIPASVTADDVLNRIRIIGMLSPSQLTNLIGATEAVWNKNGFRPAQQKLVLDALWTLSRKSDTSGHDFDDQARFAWGRLTPVPREVEELGLQVHPHRTPEEQVAAIRALERKGMIALQATGNLLDLYHYPATSSEIRTMAWEALWRIKEDRPTGPYEGPAQE